MKHRICVAVPLFGHPEATGIPKATLGCFYVLGRQLDVMMQDRGWDREDIELEPYPYPETIEHARNNLVRMFLAHPRNYTHCLFWDADEKGTPAQIADLLTRLLRHDKPIIAVPTVQKQHFWEQSARAARRHLKQHPEATDAELGEVIRGWAHRYMPDPRVQPLGPIVDDLCELSTGVTFGFVLIRRDVLEKMWTYYAKELGYDTDNRVNGGEVVGQVGLFHTILDAQRRRFLSEDYAFYERWHSMGGRMFLYTGPGAPLDHVGPAVFSGTREAFLSDWTGR